MKKTLVFFHFFEKDAVYIANFCHFLLFGYSSEYDYVVILSGKCSVELPTAENIRYVYSENKNYDYGGYCDAITQVDNLLDYEFFLFVNSSVRGPFLPSYCDRTAWVNVFTNKLVGDVGLVGLVVNILDAKSPYSQLYQSIFGGHPPFSHVQTTCYGMTREVLKKLVADGFFVPRDSLTNPEVICRYELRLSQLVLGMGMQIRSIVPEYNAIDFRREHVDINPTSVMGDPSFSQACFGRTIHPYEGVFVKMNRGVYSEPYLRRLASSLVSLLNENCLKTREIAMYKQWLLDCMASDERSLMEPTRLSVQKLVSCVKQLSNQNENFLPMLLQQIKSGH